MTPRLCAWCDSELGVWFWPTPSFVYVTASSLTELTIPAGWHACEDCAELYEAGWSDYPADPSLAFLEDIALKLNRRSLLVRHIVEARLACEPQLEAVGTDLDRELDRRCEIAERHLTGLSRTWVG